MPGHISKTVLSAGGCHSALEAHANICQATMQRMKAMPSCPLSLHLSIARSHSPFILYPWTNSFVTIMASHCTMSHEHDTFVISMLDMQLLTSKVKLLLQNKNKLLFWFKVVRASPLKHALCQNDFWKRWDDGDVIVENAHTSAVSSVNWRRHLNWLTPFCLAVNFKLYFKLKIIRNDPSILSVGQKTFSHSFCLKNALNKRKLNLLVLMRHRWNTRVMTLSFCGCRCLEIPPDLCFSLSGAACPEASPTTILAEVLVTRGIPISVTFRLHPPMPCKS